MNDDPPAPLSAARALRARLAFAAAPSRDVHPSWLPANWPARYRRPGVLNASGQEALSAQLRAAYDLGGLSSVFSRPPSVAERLAWIDSKDLRRLALMCGFIAHRAQFETPHVALQLWRQARRIEPELARFALRRWPGSAALAMSEQRLLQRPLCVGRIVARRGYRLMLGCFASESAALMRRAQLKFPRYASASPIAPLPPTRQAVYLELVHMCVVPERFPQWDWLF